MFALGNIVHEIGTDPAIALMIQLRPVGYIPLPSECL
jgi:hypothetical protein